MKIPFTKAHGAKNDFLFTWRRDAPDPAAGDHAALARAICDRHTGIGADGWMLVDPPGDPDAEGTIQLYNSDGSIAEMSGNGTRCAAAFLIRHGHAAGVVRVRTGAGIKTLRLLKRRALEFEFEMNMGRAGTHRRESSNWKLSTGPRDVTLLWVGNPQCAVPVDHFDFDWRALGAEIERHPHFPNRTNVSFVQAVDDHTHRRALLGARRRGDHEQRNRVDRGRRDGRGARLGDQSGARADSRRPHRPTLRRRHLPHRSGRDRRRRRVLFRVRQLAGSRFAGNYPREPARVRSGLFPVVTGDYAN